MSRTISSVKTDIRNAPKAGKRPPRGWPVVGTGMGVGRNMAEHARWRSALRLPEESECFSDRDCLDVLEFLLAREDSRRDLPPLVVKALQAGFEEIDAAEAEAFAARQYDIRLRKVEACA